MKLGSITITNFKGLRDAAFAPTKFSCLVGENNSGKSSVLQAITYALNRPASLPISHFYDANHAVVFNLKFLEISPRHLLRLAPEHREKIAPLVVNNSLHLVVRYSPNEKCEVKVLKLTPREARYRDDAIDQVLKGKRGGAVRAALLEAFPEFGADAPEAPNITEAKEYLQTAIRRLDGDEFELVEAALPSGISSSIAQLLPEPIYIPAVKNLGDDLKTTQSTSFGRLLGLLLEDMTPDLALVERAMATLNELLNRTVIDGVERDGRHRKVQDLETLIETLLAESFPKARIQLHIPPPELKTVLNSAQIYVDDGSRDLVDNKGDGIKRSLTFAILRALVQLQTAKAKNGEQVEDEQVPAPRPLLFLFEEPELYLHPKSQKILFDTLGKIAESYQVVVTTHSPIFFAPGVTAGFVRVAKKSAEPKPIGILYPINFELDQEKAEAFRLARFENADAGFFSSRVVLFEGESDDAYMKHVAGMLDPEWRFDQRNIALVRVSGKGNFSRYRRFFEAFGISIRIVADLDALFDGFQHLGASPATNLIRSDALQAIDRRIAELGNIPGPTPRQIKERVKQDSWRERYEAARAALRVVQQSRAVTDETLDAIDNLFKWENETKRLRVCRADDQARSALLPLLDALRNEGICVLSLGAIEDYYPPGVDNSPSKPDRALSAARLVTNRGEAERLSAPLAAGRVAELAEIMRTLFEAD